MKVNKRFLNLTVNVDFVQLLPWKHLLCSTVKQKIINCKLISKDNKKEILYEEELLGPTPSSPAISDRSLLHLQPKFSRKGRLSLFRIQ